MSMRLFNHDDPGHREAFELLPWLASDALVAGERARVEQHVVECMACKRELAALKELQEAIRNEESDVECQRGLGRMMERIDHAESASMPWMRRVARSLPGRFPRRRTAGGVGAGGCTCRPAVPSGSAARLPRTLCTDPGSNGHPGVGCRVRC